MSAYIIIVHCEKKKEWKATLNTTAIAIKEIPKLRIYVVLQLIRSLG